MLRTDDCLWVWAGCLKYYFYFREKSGIRGQGCQVSNKRNKGFSAVDILGISAKWTEVVGCSSCNSTDVG